MKQEKPHKRGECVQLEPFEAAGLVPSTASDVVMGMVDLSGIDAASAIGLSSIGAAMEKVDLSGINAAMGRVDFSGINAARGRVDLSGAARGRIDLSGANVASAIGLSSIEAAMGRIDLSGIDAAMGRVDFSGIDATATMNVLNYGPSPSVGMIFGSSQVNLPLSPRPNVANFEIPVVAYQILHPEDGIQTPGSDSVEQQLEIIVQQLRVGRRNDRLALGLALISATYPLIAEIGIEQIIQFVMDPYNLGKFLILIGLVGLPVTVYLLISDFIKK